MEEFLWEWFMLPFDRGVCEFIVVVAPIGAVCYFGEVVFEAWSAGGSFWRCLYLGLRSIVVSALVAVLVFAGLIWLFWVMPVVFVVASVCVLLIVLRCFWPWLDERLPGEAGPGNVLKRIQNGGAPYR